MKILFTQILQQMEKGWPVQLVTVVADKGSAPRGRGAMMLMAAKGRLGGTIGGGAVEYQAGLLAQKLLAEKSSLTQDYVLDQSREGGLFMACGGDVTVLLQYIDPGDAAWQAVATAAADTMAAHEQGWLIAWPEQPERAWALWTPAGQTVNGPLPEGLIAQLSGEETVSAQGCFCQPLPQGQRLLIFGGGHISQDLVPVAAHLGFRPIVFENRPEYADPALFPGAEQVLLGDYAEIHKLLTWDAEDYIVIMTNGHSHDFVVERQALAAPHRYLGVIGSRGKTKLINEQLTKLGFTQAQLDSVYTPIGLSIGAATPAELTISIVGQLIQVRAETRAASHSCPV